MDTPVNPAEADVIRKTPVKSVSFSIVVRYVQTYTFSIGRFDIDNMHRMCYNYV